jgi:hypothetical protein
VRKDKIVLPGGLGGIIVERDPKHDFLYGKRKVEVWVA